MRTDIAAAVMNRDVLMVREDMTLDELSRFFTDHEIRSRLLPLSAWLQAFAGRGYAQLPPSLHTAQPRLPAGAVLGLWTLGVPSLAFGLALDHPAWTSGGAGALALGVALTVASVAQGLVRIGATHPISPRKNCARQPPPTRWLRATYGPVPAVQRWLQRTVVNATVS